MAVDGGVADGGAVVDGAHAAAGGHPDLDCSTDPEVLRQFRPRGSYYAHAEPVEAVDGVPRVTDNRLYDMCVRNRARAHTRRPRQGDICGRWPELSKPSTNSGNVLRFDSVRVVQGGKYENMQVPC